MPDITAISTILTSLKTATDIAKTGFEPGTPASRFGSQNRHDNLSTTYAGRLRAIVTEKDRKSVFSTGSGYEMATLQGERPGEVATFVDTCL